MIEEQNKTKDIEDNRLTEKKKRAFLIKVIVIVSALIMLTLGFGIGYLYGDKNSCLSNPLVYGVEKLNELNNAYFSCECSAPGFSTYSITEEGFSKLQDQESVQATQIFNLSKAEGLIGDRHS